MCDGVVGDPINNSGGASDSGMIVSSIAADFSIPIFSCINKRPSMPLHLLLILLFFIFYYASGRLWTIVNNLFYESFDTIFMKNERNC